MKHLDLFSGIGGFALAAMTVWGKEYENVGFCEIDRYCQELLKKRFPGSVIYDDIKTLTGKEIKKVDLLTGGFPCQPFSQAGKRKGTSDERHLWPEMLRVIHEVKPTWVIAENVRGLVTLQQGMVLEQVIAGLENEGYDVQPLIIPAVAVNAPHRRDRIWIIGHYSHTHSDRRIRGHQEIKPAETGIQAFGDAQGRYSAAGNAAHTGREHGARDEVTGKHGKHGKQDKQKNAAEPQRSTERHEPGSAPNNNNNNTGSHHTPGGKTDKDRQARGGKVLTQPGARGQNSNAADTSNPGLQRNEFTRALGKNARTPGSAAQRAWNQNWFEIATRLCGVDDGLPYGIHQPQRSKDSSGAFSLSKPGHRVARLKALGNAIVPQVAVEIMKAIKEVQNDI